MNFQFKTFLALLDPFRLDRKDAERWATAIGDICQSAYEVEMGAGTARLYVDQVSDDESALIFQGEREGFEFRQGATLQISAQVPHSSYADCAWRDARTGEVAPEHDTPEHRAYAAMRTAQCDFDTNIANLLALGNLSHVGMYGTHACRSILDGKPYENTQRLERFCSEPFLFAAEKAAEIGWPNLSSIPFKNVWNWTRKNKYLLTDDFNGTRLRRAFAAYTYLSDAQSSEMLQLMWAMVAVEALYASGSADLSRQVRDKSQLFLGELTTFKKILTQMYDHRSRFIHGDIDFPNRFWTDVQESEAFNDEHYATTSIAIALLVGTLQEIIRRDWSGLSFTYQVDNFDGSQLEQPRT